jgi:hypothetical protein
VTHRNLRDITGPGHEHSGLTPTGPEKLPLVKYLPLARTEEALTPQGQQQLRATAGEVERCNFGVHQHCELLFPRGRLNDWMGEGTANAGLVHWRDENCPSK